MKTPGTRLLNGNYLCVGLILCCQVLGLGTAARVLFALTFPLTGLLWLWTVRDTLGRRDLLLLLTVALALLAVLMDALLSGAALSAATCKKWLMLTMTLMFFRAVDRLGADGDAVRVFRRVADVATVLLVVAWLLDREAQYQIEGVTSSYLTFGFQNPNLAGMFLVCLAMERLERFRASRRWIHILAAAALIVFVFLTQSRNCIGALAVYLLVRPFLTIQPVRWSGALFLAWLPALLAVLYLLVVPSPRFQWLFRFASGEGKTLDSRTEIWTEAIRIIFRAPLIGAAHLCTEGQLHNSHLELAGNYGIPVLILVCEQLVGAIRGRRAAGILGFVCCLLLGTGEAALFSGGLGIYILAGAFLMNEDTA